MKEHYLAKNFYLDSLVRLPQVRMRLDSKDCFENISHDGWFQRCEICNNYYCTVCQWDDYDACNSCIAKKNKEEEE